MDGQTPSLLVEFVLPIVLAVLGVISAVAVAAVPKLLERRGKPPALSFPNDPPLSIDSSQDVVVLLRALADLQDELDACEHARDQQQRQERP